MRCSIFIKFEMTHNKYLMRIYYVNEGMTFFAKVLTSNNIKFNFVIVWEN